MPQELHLDSAEQFSTGLASNLSKLQSFSTVLPAGLVVNISYKISSVKQQSDSTVILTTDQGLKQLPKNLVPQNFSNGDLKISLANGIYKFSFNTKVLATQNSLNLEEFVEQALHQLPNIQALKGVIFGNSSLAKQEPEIQDLIKAVLLNSNKPIEVLKDVFANLDSRNKLRNQVQTVLTESATQQLKGEKLKYLVEQLALRLQSEQSTENTNSAAPEAPGSNTTLSNNISKLIESIRGTKYTNPEQVKLELNQLIKAQKELLQTAPSELASKFVELTSEYFYNQNQAATPNLTPAKIASFKALADVLTNKLASLASTPLDLSTKNNKFNSAAIALELLNHHQSSGLSTQNVQFANLNSAELLKNVLNLIDDVAEKTLPELVKQLLKSLSSNNDLQNPGNRELLNNTILNLAKEVTRKKTSSQAEGFNFNPQALGQLKKLNQILRGQELVELLNPVVKAAGEPIFLLFPNLMNNFLSSLEITYSPENKTRVIEEEEQTSSNSQHKNRFNKIQIRLVLEHFGNVGIELQYNDHELLLLFSLENNRHACFLESQLERLKNILAKNSTRNIHLRVQTLAVKSPAPAWVRDLIASDIEA